eukprot:CAMPEP_0114665384 /NCGR_PEP_ID=MMETSP0191-20121206/30648_1 /TAXON_ID=126664 /ORGANISM="Sorites sp." /LENGTH=158 /DNA_ID=CAMNT_0001910261 /DNA_START=40 /DNA_END=516 /DNA_ORIENTATION=-
MPLTKAQFMSKEMGGFIHSDSESNFEIAKRIVKYFDDRDYGYYAAIVSDKGEWVSRYFNYSDDKFKDVYVKNKRIQVWKQTSSCETSRMKSNFGAFVDGLIKKYGNTKPIKEALDNELGGYYAVVEDKYCASSYYTYNSKHRHTTSHDDYYYEVWRQA